MSDQQNSAGQMLSVYHFEPVIEALGPGKRAGLWLQGCTLGCEGCLVPDSHNPDAGSRQTISKLVESICALKPIEGISVSGGEPFQQTAGLLSLLETIKQVRPELSVMIFTGYRIASLCKDPVAVKVLELTDILVDGPFQLSRQQPDRWRGSANQEVHFLTDRYGVKEYLAAVPNHMEWFVHNDGTLFSAGIPAPGELEDIDRQLKAQGIIATG